MPLLILTNHREAQLVTFNYNNRCLCDDIETPSVPLNVQVSRSRVQLSTPCSLSVSWDPPENSKRFDLDHFKVHIMLPDQAKSYIANGTSMEPEYHFHSDDVVIPAQNSIHVMVTAVSKCNSQQSLSGPFAVDLNEVNPDKIMLTNFPDVLSRTDRGPKVYEHSMINGK